MYYYNKNSSKKIIHLRDCFRLENRDEKNIGSFETLEEAYANGYRLCRNCSPIAIKYKREINEIMYYGQKNGISSFFHDKFIGVESLYGKWKITVAPDGKHIRLYHKNEFETKNDYKSAVPGYHLQNVHCDSIADYFNYIAEHDWYRTLNPLYIRPKEKKQPPRKGTRRYRAAQNRAKKREMKRSIGNVLNLIDSLQMQNQSII